jgi:hypothetical protein
LTGNRNIGVALDSALREVQTNGFPIIGKSERIYITEAWDCDTAADYYSGIARGMRGIHGRFVPGGGHAEFVPQIIVDSAKIIYRVCGTWQGQGEDGYYDASEKSITQGIPKFGGFLIRAAEIR